MCVITVSVVLTANGGNNCSDGSVAEKRRKVNRCLRHVFALIPAERLSPAIKGPACYRARLCRGSAAGGPAGTDVCPRCANTHTDEICICFYHCMKIRVLLETDVTPLSLLTLTVRTSCATLSVFSSLRARKPFVAANSRGR